MHRVFKMDHNSRSILLGSTFFLALACKSLPSYKSEETGVASIKQTCDVIVAGGSTAALAAALSSAEEGVKTCLLEPTDWAGGQMTASAVSAIDFAHHRPNGIDIPGASLDQKNWNKDFAKILAPFRSNPGKCWVSAICYEPLQALERTINPLINSRQANLTVFYNTVVKNVVKAGGKLVRLQAVQRFPLKGKGWEFTMSKNISDWYSLQNSSEFKKNELILTGQSSQNPIFIDATEFGDVMALSGAEYLQGLETADGSLINQDTCGQAIVYPLVLSSEPIPKTPVNNPIDSIKETIGNIIKPVSPPPTVPFDDGIPNVNTDLVNFFSLGKFSFSQVWSYRRIKESAATQIEHSLQNWYPGNDYGGGYFLKSKAATRAETSNWSGGVNKEILGKAENHAFAWARWYLQKAPSNSKLRYKLNKEILGTSHGLSKMPYIRDTRRSIGIDDFILKFSDLKDGNSSDPIANPFPDRVAIGAYVADIHSVNNCSTPSYLEDHDTHPFFIPLRALTNKSFDNLLVAGKTMAQSYHANAATRLQPIEWNSGAAAGIAASYMVKNQIRTTREMLNSVDKVQKIIKAVQPIDWTISGKTYPAANPASSQSNNLETE